MREIEDIRFEISRLDREERSAFDEAMQKCPDLVMEESDPLLFLRHEEGSIRAAALRLAAYWKHRVDLFQERAFLPMILSGAGALTSDDIEALRTGFHALLPDDVYGNTVLYYDHSRASSIHMRDVRQARFRSVFYFFSLAMMREKPLLYIRFSDSPEMDKGRAGRIHKMFDIFPIKLKKLLCLYAPGKGGKRIFQHAVAPLLENFIGKDRLPGPIQSVVEDTPQALCQVLVKEGLSASGIPCSSGGKWSFENFMAWLTNQFREDGQVQLANEPAASAAVDPIFSVDRKERKRQTDLEYSRKRRQRVKQEQEEAQTQYGAIVLKNKALKEETRRLESLLADAILLVADFHRSQQDSKPVVKAPSQDEITKGGPIRNQRDAATFSGRDQEEVLARLLQAPSQDRRVGENFTPRPIATYGGRDEAMLRLLQASMRDGEVAHRAGHDERPQGLVARLPASQGGMNGALFRLLRASSQEQRHLRSSGSSGTVLPMQAPIDFASVAWQNPALTAMPSFGASASHLHALALRHSALPNGLGRLFSDHRQALQPPSALEAEVDAMLLGFLQRR